LSLLLDALKRAEQEKLARQGGTRPEGERDRLSAVQPAPAAAAAKPAANLELQPLASAAAASTAPRADAQAAQNVFQAKEAPATRAGAVAPAPRKNTFLWVAVGVIALVVLGAGGYVWWQVNSFSPRAAANSRARPGSMPTVGPITSITTAPDAPAPAAQKTETFVPAQQPSTAIQPGSQQAVTAAAEAAAKEKIAPPKVPEAERVRETVAALLKESSTPADTAPLKLAPSRDAPRVAPEVARGYRELVAGDIGAAHKSYAAALDADPLNVDALLGIATIEARTGNRMLAASHYRKALEVDPRNPTAMAGLASVAEFSRADNAESQLRADLAMNPGSAALHFTLGNLYALQARWGEAQVEYFEAYRIEPASADYAYNLAVSLDHMRQPKLAAEYYERAIDAARNQATQFDPQAAARRLAQLKG
jgi:tetratricopeptide (TPR) repeat protein